ncbi:hypothetical protein MRX96_011744 [Rhipicephalus microplus]
MDDSEEGSLLFTTTARRTRSSRRPKVEGWSPPSPWRSPPARWHRRFAHTSESPFGGTSEDESYVSNNHVADTGSSSILYLPARKLSHERSQIYRDTSASRRRHVSLPSRLLAKGRAVHARSSVSPGPNTPPRRLHRSRVQSIELFDRHNDPLQWAAQRHTARGLYEDVNDGVNSSRIQSPLTHPAISESKYTSHARAPRRLQQRVMAAPRRRVTSAPPRVRVALLSKNGTLSFPPSPPVDEFTDIPPVDLILYEPPKPVIAGVQPHGASALALKPSPPRGMRLITMQDLTAGKDDTRSESPLPMTTAVGPSLCLSGVEEPPASPAEPDANDRVTCRPIWVLCVATVTTLCIPYGTVILSYLLTPVRDMSNLTAGPSGYMTNSRSTSTVVPEYTFTIPLNPSTIDPWNVVPQACRTTPMVKDNTTEVHPQTSPPSMQSSLTRVYCLYNNTKFYRGGTYDFLPQNLPFYLCRNVVYWSFGVRDGVPISRVESFDRKYGLEKLSEVAHRSGARNVQILLAVGGYIEDYAQLSLLGRDAAALSRFAHHAMALMQSHFLNGVVVHWIEGEPLCKYSAVDDGQVLRTVFSSLRQIFQLNSFSGQLAAIVSTGSTTGYAVVDTILDIVNIVFIEARNEWHSVNLDTDMCNAWGQNVLRIIASLPLYPASNAKFGVVMSAAPLMVEAHTSSRGQLVYDRISNSSSYGSAPGLGSVWDMCGPPHRCCLKTYSSWKCIVVSKDGSLLPLYVITDPATMRHVFWILSLNIHRYVLLVDLDLDNYANQIPSHSWNYFLTTYVHTALNNVGHDYVSNLIQPCGH